MAVRSVRHWFADHGVAAACAVAALLVVAVSMPVHAQRLSLSERVAHLEQAQQKQQGKQGGTMLVNQVQALQSQVQQLQNQVEKLQHQIKQQQQSGKDQYVDLDSRLRRLEGGNAPASGSSVAAPGSADNPARPASAPAQTRSTPAPAQGASVAAPADSADAQDAYNKAFTALRNGQFVQSSRQFRAFIQQYPDSALAPNAYYWLGESYYTVQNFDVALKTFQKLSQLYPDSEKAPGALLKTGYCQDALNHDAAAVSTLKSVMSNYPGSSEARLAKQRLQDIQLRQAN